MTAVWRAPWVWRLALLFLVFAELECYDIAFEQALLPLKSRTDLWVFWGYLRLIPRYTALFSAGLAILLLVRLGSYRDVLLYSERTSLPAFACHLLAALFLAMSTWLVAANLLALTNAVLVPLTMVALVAAPVWMVSAFLTVASRAFWWEVVRQNRWQLALVIVGTLAYRIGAKAFPDLEQSIADVLFAPTVGVASALSGVWGHVLEVDSVARTARLGSFAVIFGPPCVGYQGVVLLFTFLAVHLFVSRHELRFPNVLLVVPVALLCIWLLNAVRIAALMVIGAHWSPQIAMEGFHSAAGWWSLTLVCLACVWATRKLRFFAKSPDDTPLELSDEKVLLLPQLTLLAVALGTLLFTASFEWLYPVRVVVVGGVLWHFRHRFGLGAGRVSSVALGMGVLVFAVWIALVPVDADKSLAFGTELFSVPTAGVVAWVLFRLVGAVLVVPLAEELAFRGFLLPKCEELLTAVPPNARLLAATLVSSLAFGALHSAWMAGTLAGIGFALARQHRGHLWDAITAHMTANLLVAAYVLAGGNWSLW